MAIVDLSIFDEELGDCYKFSRDSLVNLHFNNQSVDEEKIFDKAMGNVKDRFLQGVYLSFKGFEHIYYYDCSNPDVPKVEFPGILVLPSSDGLHRFEFENTNKVSIVLTDNNNNKHEFTIDSCGLYRVEDGQVIKSESYDLLDEIIEFRYEMTRIYLSPRVFPNENYHTCEEILNELVNRRKSGDGKVFLTQFETPKNVNNYKITESQPGVGVIVNPLESSAENDREVIEGDGIMDKKKMIRKKLVTSSMTSSELGSSTTTETQVISIEISETTTETIIRSSTSETHEEIKNESNEVVKNESNEVVKNEEQPNEEVKNEEQPNEEVKNEEQPNEEVKNEEQPSEEVKKCTCNEQPSEEVKTESNEQPSEEVKTESNEQPNEEAKNESNEEQPSQLVINGEQQIEEVKNEEQQIEEVNNEEQPSEEVKNEEVKNEEHQPNEEIKNEEQPNEEVKNEEQPNEEVKNEEQPSEEVKKCTCNDQCPSDCTCVDNCNPDCTQCRSENKQIIDEDNNNNTNAETPNPEAPNAEANIDAANAEAPADGETTENKPEEKPEDQNKIHLFTTYDNVHVWDCEVKSEWPGLTPTPVGGDKWKEIVLNSPHCCVIGNFSGTNSSPEIRIETPGNYHLENGVLTKE